MNGFKTLSLALFLLTQLTFGQIPLSKITEDKSDMADNYYGTFKFEGKAYTGKVIAYYPSGTIKTIRNFKEGKYHGIWTEWHENGNRKFQGDRSNNKGDGLTKWWHENGQLKKMGTYDMDKQQGIVLRWHPNGALKQIRHYEQDKPTGPWSMFDKQGDILDEGDDDHIFFRPYFGEQVAPDGFEETSPSFTADGKTMVFARYQDWVKKVPYMAEYQQGKWVKERLNFVDTLYNLAISPDGKRIVYKTFEFLPEEEITHTFIVDKKGSSWGKPREVKNLYNLNAGYFQIGDDGTLFMFAREPRRGIFYSKPHPTDHYTRPVWLSDDVGLEGSDSFDVLMHPEGDRLIVTQAYSTKKWPERGPIGLYYYEKRNGDWERIKRLPLAYAWGASITPDGKFVFVRNGNIQYVKINDLDIPW